MEDQFAYLMDQWRATRNGMIPPKELAERMLELRRVLLKPWLDKAGV